MEVDTTLIISLQGKPLIPVLQIRSRSASETPAC